MTRKTICGFLTNKITIANYLFSEIIKNYFKHTYKNLIKPIEYAK